MAGKLTSKTIYAFDLDRRMLQVRDYDLFHPDQSVTLSKNQPYKQTAANVKNALAELRWAEQTHAGLHEAHRESKLVNPNRAQIVREGSQFKVVVHKSLEVGPETALLLSLAYEVDLKGSGPSLLYCGAIQPSDLAGVRDGYGLELSGFEKEVMLVVHSEKRKFSASVYDGAAPAAFPDLVGASHDRVHRFEHTFSIRIQRWDRAWYFGLHAHLG